MNQNELIEKLRKNFSKRVQTFPAKEDCKKFVDDLFEFFFVHDISNKEDDSQLVLGYSQLKNEFCRLLNSILKNIEQTEKQCEIFFSTLPAIYDSLIRDAEAILAGDPAAENMEEVLIAYPGFFATAVYRLSHQLSTQGLRTFSRFFTEYAHSKTGIDIHPGAIIGHSFAIDHGTGVVIGETTIIGNNVKIYQGVTLGALIVSKEKARMKRHPTIQDNVVIYAGATILGGETIIGSGSIIGGNVWLTHSVPVNSVVYHKSEVHVKDNNPFPEPLNFVI